MSGNLVRIYFFAVALIFVVTGMLRAQTGNGDLLAVDSAFVNGEYERVELLVLRILQTNPELTSDETARICLTTGYSLIMLGREPEAREYFVKALDAVPTLALDPEQVSPKFRMLFDEVKAGHHSEVPKNITIAQPSDEERGDERLSGRRRTAVAMNLLAPGLGHARLGRQIRGAVWLAAEAGAVVWLVSNYQESQDARDKYLRATETADLESKYDDYDAAYRRTWLAGGVAAGVYVLSQLDLALVNRRQVRLAVQTQRSGVSLAVRIPW